MKSRQTNITNSSHSYQNGFKRKSKCTIHVKIKSSKNKSITNSFRTYATKTSVNSFKSTHSVKQLYKSVEVQHYTWPSKRGNIQNHHHTIKKKRKNHKICTPTRIVISVLIVTLIIGIIATIPPLILLNKSTKTTFPPRIVELLWNKTGIVILGTSGIPGDTNFQLNSPYDVVVDYEYSLYVADYNNSRIQKFPRGSRNGTTIAGNGTRGSSATQLSNACRILVDFNGNIRIVDSGNHRVQLWKKGASAGITIAGTGLWGNANNELAGPISIYHDIPTDTLYIADRGNHRIMRYLSGASSGTIVAGGNGAGKNYTQLSNPHVVHFDSFSNSCTIINDGNHNVVRWPLGATNWTLLVGDIEGNYGSNSTMLRWPHDLILDPMDNMYIADKNNYRIQLFLNGQKEGITIANVLAVGSISGSVYGLPFSIELDNQLNLYVADSFNHRIQKFLRY